MYKPRGFTYIQKVQSDQDISLQSKNYSLQNITNSKLGSKSQRKLSVQTDTLLNLQKVRNERKHQKSFLSKDYNSKTKKEIENIEKCLVQNQFSQTLNANRNSCDKKYQSQQTSLIHSRSNSTNDLMVNMKINKENIDPNVRKPKKKISPRKSLVPSQNFEKIFSKNSLKIEFEPQLFNDDLITKRRSNQTFDLLNFEQTIKYSQNCNQAKKKSQKTSKFQVNQKNNNQDKKRKNSFSSSQNCFQSYKFNNHSKRRSDSKIRHDCLQQIQKISKHSLKSERDQTSARNTNFIDTTVANLCSEHKREPKSKIEQGEIKDPVDINNDRIHCEINLSLESVEKENPFDLSRQNSTQQPQNTPETENKVSITDFDTLVQGVNISEKMIDDYLFNIQCSSEQHKNQCKVDEYQTMKNFQFTLEEEKDNCKNSPINFIQQNFSFSPQISKNKPEKDIQDIKKLTVKNTYVQIQQSVGDLLNLSPLQCNEVFENKVKSNYEELIQNMLNDNDARNLQYRPNPLYLCQQKEITWFMRAILFDWLQQVCVEFRLLRRTYQIAINLIDRFVQQNMETKPNQYQLIGLTALLISTKSEVLQQDIKQNKIKEITYPQVNDFVQLCDGAFQLSDIKRMELDMLKALSWMINPQIFESFTQLLMAKWDTFIIRQKEEFLDLQFHKCCAKSYEIYSQIQHLIDLITLDNDSLNYGNKNLVLSAMYLILSLKINQFSQEEICLEIPQKVWKVILKKSCFNKVFQDFLESEIRVLMTDIVPTVQFVCSFFLNLAKSEISVEIDYFLGLKSEENYNKYKEAILRQTHSPQQLDILQLKKSAKYQPGQ